MNDSAWWKRCKSVAGVQQGREVTRPNRDNTDLSRLLSFPGCFSAGVARLSCRRPPCCRPDPDPPASGRGQDRCAGHRGSRSRRWAPRWLPRCCLPRHVPGRQEVDFKGPMAWSATLRQEQRGPFWFWSAESYLLLLNLKTQIQLRLEIIKRGCWNSGGHYLMESYKFVPSPPPNKSPECIIWFSKF